MTEWLHATNRQGAYVKSQERTELLAEIRNYSLRHGDAHLAVPVVHIILLTSDGKIRLVQRGDKPENPFMWDKAVGGHVVSENRHLSRQDFDNNARKELHEEVGLSTIIMAEDNWHYHHLIQSKTHDLEAQAVIRLIDYDPWQGAISRTKGGESWLKRHNVAVYAGIFDGPFRFLDHEAQDHRLTTPHELMADVQATPWKFADGVRIFMQRYYYLLK